MTAIPYDPDLRLDLRWCRSLILALLRVDIAEQDFKEKNP